MKRFENKIALVTGATRGIGFATARRFAEEGAHVVITGHSADHINVALNQLAELGLSATGLVHDANNVDNCIEVTRRVIDDFGQLDVLVNNVGGTNLQKDAPIGQLDLDYFDEAMRFNLLSMMATIKTAIPTMIHAGGGAIVNIASISGITGDFRGTLYGTSKAGVINLCRYVATQYGKQGIRCNGIAPGLVLTDAATGNLDEKTRNIFLRQNALPYFGQPEDIAATAAFLASDDARYITGQTITADGGLTCHNPTTADLMGL
ncbi:MAG: SDR family oxidoreductase [Muribaculaceae bacterium]|nr:SDR family oxidoreductase [Muribaculaceae bacterium]